MTDARPSREEGRSRHRHGTRPSMAQTSATQDASANQAYGALTESLHIAGLRWSARSAAISNR